MFITWQKDILTSKRLKSIRRRYRQTYCEKGTAVTECVGATGMTIHVAMLGDEEGRGSSEINDYQFILSFLAALVLVSHIFSCFPSAQQPLYCHLDHRSCTLINYNAIITAYLCILLIDKGLYEIKRSFLSLSNF